MGSGGTDDVGAGWRTARGADEAALLSEEITAARVRVEPPPSDHDEEEDT